MFKWIKGAGVALGATVLVVPLMAGTAMANPTPTGTTTVNVEIQGAGGILDIPGNGSASVYYHGSWQAIDGLNSNNHKLVQAKLAPGTYSFAATYNGTRQQVNGVTVGDSAKTVYFQAASVNLTLQDNKGGPLTADSASYYAGGWKAMSDGTADMLPGTYSFAATYNGTRQQNQFTIVQPNSNNGANRFQAVGFQTTLVNVQASDHTIVEGSNIVLADASYYAGGWHAMTIVNANNHNMRQAQMLPGTYSFADVYNNVRQQKNGVKIGTGSASHVQSVYFGF